MTLPAPSFGGGAALENLKIASTVDASSLNLASFSGKILITEVFPSPSSKAESGSFLGREWIEFLNTSSEPFFLRGSMLRIGKKTITFGQSSVLDPGKNIVLLVDQVGLKLKNDGDDIHLYSPEKSLLASLSYPKTKIGESYVFDTVSESYCISKSPSAGHEGACSIQTPAATKTKTASSKKATSKPRVSVYDKYAASYRAGLDANQSDREILIGSKNSGSIPSTLFVFFGILLGSLGSLLALKLPSVRQFVEK